MQPLDGNPLESRVVQDHDRICMLRAEEVTWELHHNQGAGNVTWELQHGQDAAD